MSLHRLFAKEKKKKTHDTKYWIKPVQPRLERERGRLGDGGGGAGLRGERGEARGGGDAGGDLLGDGGVRGVLHGVAMQVEGDSLLIGRHIQYSAFSLADRSFSQSYEEEVDLHQITQRAAPYHSGRHVDAPGREETAAAGSLRDHDTRDVRLAHLSAAVQAENL
jgi:hypothetical protein